MYRVHVRRARTAPRLVELVGDDAIDERAGRIVVTTQDPAAMIGVLQ